MLPVWRLGNCRGLVGPYPHPAEHQRIANFYAANALNYCAQAKEHEAMIAEYKSNTSISNDKNRASTIGHCEYFVKSLNDLAVKSDELAELHKEMAQEAAKKLNKGRSPGPSMRPSGPGS